MSLTSQIANKRSPVRQFLDRELGGVTPVCRAANHWLRNGRTGGPPVGPVGDADPGLVGLATEFVFAAVGNVIAGRASRPLRRAASSTGGPRPASWRLRSLRDSPAKAS